MYHLLSKAVVPPLQPGDVSIHPDISHNIQSVRSEEEIETAMTQTSSDVNEIKHVETTPRAQTSHISFALELFIGSVVVLLVLLLIKSRLPKNTSAQASKQQTPQLPPRSQP